MKGFLTAVLFAMCALSATPATAASAQRFIGRIGGGVVATQALHAVILLVTRDDLGDGQFAMGGGSIVARNRVLTAAHVVQGATGVQVGFFAGSIQANRFRRVDSAYSQPIQTFDVETFDNDIAVIQFSGNAFPLASVIAIGTAALAPPAPAFLASFGFTEPGKLVPSQLPQLSSQLVAACPEELKAQESHFCGQAQGTSVVCPGDNGSGLYTETTAGTPAVTTRTLVGVVSLISKGCTGTGGFTGYAHVTTENVLNFLRSQGLTIA